MEGFVDTDHKTQLPVVKNEKRVISHDFRGMYKPLPLFKDLADKAAKNNGITDLYPTDDPVLNEYLGGGIGRQSGYEVVLIFGPTGSFKSTLALNLAAPAIRQNKKVALWILEDAPEDVYNRLRSILGEDVKTYYNTWLLADQSQGYTITQAKSQLEQILNTADVLLLDHLEYLFSGSVGEPERDKWTKQEMFMRNINNIVKNSGKTVILVQHTNKSLGEGMDQIKGSSALQQTATKVLSIKKISNESKSIKQYDEKAWSDRYNGNTLTIIQQWKSRFVKKYGDYPLITAFDNNLRIHSCPKMVAEYKDVR